MQTFVELKCIVGSVPVCFNYDIMTATVPFLFEESYVSKCEVNIH